MKKEELITVGLSEEIIKFVTSDTRNNRALNQEGLELGDKFTITGVADKVSENVIGGNNRSWIDVLTTGDRQTISISRLVGTSKRVKYFDAEKRSGETEDGEPLVEVADLTERKVLALPNREADALVEVMKNHIGKTYECVGIARDCGQWLQTYYLFAEA